MFWNESEKIKQKDVITLLSQKELLRDIKSLGKIEYDAQYVFIAGLLVVSFHSAYERYKWLNENKLTDTINKFFQNAPDIEFKFGEQFTKEENKSYNCSKLKEHLSNYNKFNEIKQQLESETSNYLAIMMRPVYRESYLGQNQKSARDAQYK